MQHTKRTDFHAVNCLGTTLSTFDNIESARAWAKRMVERFPSIRIERVTYSVERELVFRPRQPKARKMEQAA
jgi:hypothetical protein